MRLPGIKFPLRGGCEPGVLEGVEEHGVESGPENSKFEGLFNLGMVPKRFEFVKNLCCETKPFV